MVADRAPGMVICKGRSLISVIGSTVKLFVGGLSPSTARYKSQCIYVVFDSAKIYALHRALQEPKSMSCPAIDSFLLGVHWKGAGGEPLNGYCFLCLLEMDSLPFLYPSRQGLVGRDKNVWR